ncbi:MAG: hypothetical protein RBS39_11230 [Phycisphaerales bacterium]|jgi:hypothetical protein|nr:hypothetical protein [Phycisphaerales bacterium]
MRTIKEMPKGRLAAWLGGAGVLLVALLVCFRAWYLAPVAERLEKIKTARASITALSDRVDQWSRVRTREKAVASHSLGSRSDEVEHWARALLSELATGAGLADVVVGTGELRVERNPAARERGLHKSVRDALQREAGFAVMTADVRGVGSYAAAYDLLAALEAQPWIARVESFEVRPANKDRSAFNAVARVWCMSYPGAGETAHAVVPAGEASRELARSIASRELFLAAAPAPKPEPPAVRNPPPKPRDPPAPPYAEWRLTGITESSRGVEAMFWNGRENRGAVLKPGDNLLGLVLIEASGERAVLEEEGGRSELSSGQTLAERRRMT